MHWARVIAWLKEAYRPFSKEEVLGSSTAMHYRSPYGIMEAIKWVVCGIRDTVLIRWILP
jgi:hypothetical protein